MRNVSRAVVSLFCCTIVIWLFERLVLAPDSSRMIQGTRTRNLIAINHDATEPVAEIQKHRPASNVATTQEQEIPSSSNPAFSSPESEFDVTPILLETPEDISRPEDKIVVMGKMGDEDTSWVNKLPAWQSAVYHVDDLNASLHTTINKGHEANVYLTYIIDNYDNLPSTIAFVHSHEDGYPRAWHTDALDYSNVHSLENLNIDFVQRNGYANLRCIAIPGCPDEIQPFREPYEADRDAEHLYADAWVYIFEDDDVPAVVGTPCCAQFAVSRTQVHAQPRKLYMRAQQWLMDTSANDGVSGRVFEYMWHILFGQGPVYCPSLDECYRDVYGHG